MCFCCPSREQVIGVVTVEDLVHLVDAATTAEGEAALDRALTSTYVMTSTRSPINHCYVDGSRTGTLATFAAERGDWSLVVKLVSHSCFDPAATIAKEAQGIVIMISYLERLTRSASDPSCVDLLLPMLAHSVDPGSPSFLNLTAKYTGIPCTLLHIVAQEMEMEAAQHILVDPALDLSAQHQGINVLISLLGTVAELHRKDNTYQATRKGGRRPSIVFESGGTRSMDGAVASDIEGSRAVVAAHSNYKPLVAIITLLFEKAKPGIDDAVPGTFGEDSLRRVFSEHVTLPEEVLAIFGCHREHVDGAVVIVPEERAASAGAYAVLPRAAAASAPPHASSATELAAAEG